MSTRSIELRTQTPENRTSVSCVRSLEPGYQNQRKGAYDLDSFDAMVTVNVGPQKKPFRLHKSLLCQSSSYFDAALNGNFKEAEEQVIEMLEEDVETFRHLRYWMYSKTLKLTTDKECDIGWRQLINIFIFAEARGIPNLLNSALDGIIEKHYLTEWTPLEQIPYIYDNTALKSPLRQLFVDLMIRHCKVADDS